MEKVNTYKLLEEVRSLLKLTIEQFCDDMNWPNANYYDAIKSGIRRKDGTKKPSSPTINKLFDGINYAIANHGNWKKHSSEITAIVVKHLFKK